MADADLGALIGRMILSLVVVLAIVLGAYAVLRRRGGRGAARVPTTTSRRSATRNAGPRQGLRVLARAGLGRNTGVAAVQFAERVLLVGSSEHGAPTLLGELSLEDWIEITAPAEELTPLVTAAPLPGASPPGDPLLAGTAPAAPPGLLQALREATTRRA